MDRIQRKKTRIRTSTRYLEDAKWWHRMYDEYQKSFYEIKDARIGARMGRYYRGIAYAINKKLLSEQWVRKLGVTKAALVAEDVLRVGRPMPKSLLATLAHPELTCVQVRNILRA